MIFQDRVEAGLELARHLEHYANAPDVLVFALPRGGVPVAYEVARVLNAPLDVFVVRKLGAPGQEELAIGAIATGGVRIINDGLVRTLGITDRELDELTVHELEELKRRERVYRENRQAPDVRGRTVILIDDGLATGSTMFAAVAALRRQQPARIVVAVPVAARETCDRLRSEVNEVVCAATPQPFQAVGLWYRNFSQTTDQEVRELLETARKGSAITVG